VLPTASYRLQLTPTFDFDRVVDVLPSIADLGFSHLYLSPIAEAVSGSQHGYDVTDHSRVRDDFGGQRGLESLLDAAEQRGMGVIVDHVPNHVSVEHAEQNPMWWRMLAEGPDSDAAAWFDVDWTSTGGKVIVPRLGRPLDEMLPDGEIGVGVDAAGRHLDVGSLRLPLRAGTEGLELGELLDQQHYRLQWWRDPRRNVRRFFTIDDLVAVRIENQAVARVVDTLIRNLTAHSAFAGVRVDHVDGLADPAGYLGRLRDQLGDRLLLIEKIVAPGEELPEAWPVDGTTGYEHIAAVEHTLLDPAAAEPLTRLWFKLAGGRSFHDLDRAARLEVLDDGLRPDLDRLVRTVLAERSDSTAAGQDPHSTREAVIDLTLGLDRYRTYLPDPASAPFFEALVGSAIDRAGDAARRDEIGRVAHAVSFGGESQIRWQQLTGPAMAKGAEDRAFYRYFPLASLAEVGGSPNVDSMSIADFHEIQRRRSVRSPRAMLASTTHDTKRSSSVRDRSLGLAACCDVWIDAVTDWIATNVDAIEEIDRRFVYLALQTAVTARPLTSDRLHAYLVKAAREGDEITSWIEPDEVVESALGRLADLAVAAGADGALADLADEIERLGAAVGLRTLTLQLTCSGFPDLYQGSPMQLLSLVDPDNRTPPSWDELRAVVDRGRSTDSATAFDEGDIDASRAALCEQLLHFRAQRPETFDETSRYQELAVRGPGAGHVIAFARTELMAGSEDPEHEPTVIVIVTRARSGAIDGDGTRIDLPLGGWRSLVHGGEHRASGGPTRLADLMSSAEVAVLARTDR